MPLVAKATSGSSALRPAIYAVVIVQVIVMSPVVLLKIEMTSPAAKVELGIVIEPLAPTSMNLPTSPVAKIYEVVLAEPDCGMFLKPTELVPSTVQPERVPDVGVPRTGVTKVGEVARAIPPEPVTFCPRAVATPVPKDVMPVPPLAAASVACYLRS
jgi:hypothetical protein